VPVFNADIYVIFIVLTYMYAIYSDSGMGHSGLVV